MGAGFHGGFGKTQGEKNHTTEELVAELKKSGTKFTKEDIVFITKDATGQVVWLEKGNAGAGLEHIMNGSEKTVGHAKDFKKTFGVSRDQIPSFLNNIVSKGTIVSNELRIINGREGFERIYYFDGKHYVLAGIGTNGFIVTAYPIEYGG